MLKRWPAFTRFIDEGRICLSNNAAERLRVVDFFFRAESSRRRCRMPTAATGRRPPWDAEPMFRVLVLQILYVYRLRPTQLIIPSNNPLSCARPAPMISKKARTRAVLLRSTWVTIQSSPSSSGMGLIRARAMPSSPSPR